MYQLPDALADRFRLDINRVSALRADLILIDVSTGATVASRVNVAASDVAGAVALMVAVVDGLACCLCGRGADDAPMVPTGTTTVGQLFACSPTCP